MPDALAPRNPDWQAVVQDSFARQAVMATFEVSMVLMEPGHCILEMPFHQRWTQQGGSLQAGIPAVLADSAGGFACLSLMPAGSDVLAVEFKINFLAPALGQIIRAEAVVVKSGRTLSINQVDVYGVDGDTVRHAARVQQTAIRVDTR